MDKVGLEAKSGNVISFALAAARLGRAQRRPPGLESRIAQVLRSAKQEVAGDDLWSESVIATVKVSIAIPARQSRVDVQKGQP